MTRPSFSICIPNFNYAHYIGETIQSVLAQTYPDYEIVIVDNASTDNSLEVIRAFNDSRIHLFSNQYNIGFAPNLDRAAQRAQNPYIIMLSSDDLMRPTALEEYAKIIEKLGPRAEHALVVSSIDVIDGQGCYVERQDRQNYFTISPDQSLTAFLEDPDGEIFGGLAVFKEVYSRMTVPGHFCSTLYSRRLYERLDGYSSLNHIGPDAHFVYKALLQDVLVVFINRPLFAYRIHTANQLSQDSKRMTIKVPIDRYLFSIQYSDADLARAGVRRDVVNHFWINDSCINKGLLELSQGSRYQAFRLLMFAFAAEPSIAVRNPKSYLLCVLLGLGPLGSTIARRLLKIYRAQRR